MDIPHFISLSPGGYLGFSYFLSIIDNAAVDIDVHIFVWTYIFISLRSTPKKGISGSYNSSILNNLRNFQTVFKLAVQFSILISSISWF